MKKKFLAFLLTIFCVLSCAFSLAACGGGEGGGTNPGIEHQHNYGAWEITKNPTCTDSGTREKRCIDSGCTHKVEETINPLGHDYRNGYCSRCHAIDPNDATFSNDRNISVVNVNGTTVSWARLKCASKYTIKIGEGAPIDIEKEKASIDLSSYIQDKTIGYGKTSAVITVYEHTKDDETGIEEDIPVSATDIKITNYNSGLTISKMEYKDEYITLQGFDSDVKEDSNKKEYLNIDVELVTKANSNTMLFNLNKRIKANNHQEYSVYKTEQDKNDNTNAITGFSWNNQTIRRGQNTYYLRVATSDSTYKDYTLVVNGVAKVNVSVNIESKIKENGLNRYTLTNAGVTLSVSENDFIDSNVIFDSLDTKYNDYVLRDNMWNIFAKGEDVAIDAACITANRNYTYETTLYVCDKDSLSEEKKEIEYYKQDYDLKFSFEMVENTDNDYFGLWTMKFKDTKEEVVFPSAIAGSKTSLNNTFRYSTKIKSVVIMTGVTEIADYAFQDAKNLTKVAIPATVTQSGLGSMLFSGCDADKLEIKCESSYLSDNTSNDWRCKKNNKTQFYDAIFNQTGICSQVVESGYRCAIDINNNTATIIANAGGNSEEIPSSVRFGIKEYKITKIAGNIWVGKTAVNIPSFITDIELSAFGVKSNGDTANETVVTITVDPTNTAYSAKDNILYNKDMSEIIYVPYLLQGEITLSDSLISISDSCFKGRTNITKVTLPNNNSITAISHSMFNYCTNLREVVFGDNIKTIRPYAFGACENLETISDLSHITTIGRSAFASCQKLAGKLNLTGLTASDSLDYLAFYDCKAITGIIFSQTTGFDSIPSRAFEGCIALTDITLPETLTEIGSSAFKGCIALTEITLPETLTAIRSSAFEGCAALTEITLPEALTAIDSSAFKGCIALTEITLSKKLAAIDSSTFEGCTALTKITLPEALTIISSSAFKGCNKLATVTGLNEAQIGERAFEGCTALKNIDLSNVTILKSWALSGCSFDEVTFNKLKEVDGRSFTGLAVNSLIINSENVSTSDGYFDNYSFEDSIKKMVVPDFMATGLPKSVTDLTITKAKTGEVRSMSYLYTANNQNNILTKLSIGSGITSIINSAFTNFTALTDLVIDENAQVKIGNSAFSGCTNLTNVVLGGATELGDEVFLKTKITTIDLPGSVTKVGKFALTTDNSTGYLGSISKKTVTVNYLGTFEQYIKMTAKSTNNGSEYIYGDKYTYYIINQYAKEFNFVKDTLTDITVDMKLLDNQAVLPKYIFDDIKGIGHLTIYGLAINKDSKAFNNCEIEKLTLKNARIESGGFGKITNLKYLEILGCDNITSEAFNYSYTEHLQEYIGPQDGISYGSNLTKVTLNKLTSNLVGDRGLLYNATNITDLVITDNTSGYTLARSSLYYQKALKNLAIPFIPSGLTLGDLYKDPNNSSSQYCNNKNSIGKLESLSIDSGEFTQGGSVEANTGRRYSFVNLKNITLGDGVTSADLWSLFNLNIGSGLKTLTVDFGNASSDTVITVSEKNETFAVYNGLLVNKKEHTLLCATMSAVDGGVLTIPDNIGNVTITKLGERALYGLSGVTTLTIANGIKAIEDYALYMSDSSKLTKLTVAGDLNEGSPKIEYQNLKELVFTVTNDYICRWTIKCPNLARVVIPAGVSRIVENVYFTECTKLVEIYNLSSVTLTIGSDNNGQIAKYAEVIHTDLSEPSILDENYEKKTA